MNSQDILNLIQTIAILVLLTFFIILFFQINKTIGNVTTGLKLFRDFVLKSRLWMKKLPKLKKII